MTLNTKKSQMSNSLEDLLLGFTNTGAIPHKPQGELLASLLYPKIKIDENRLLTRSISISYANCGQHSKVCEICEDVLNYFESKRFSPDFSGLLDFI